MPKSRARTKKPSSQRGIPTALLARSPDNLSPENRAEWCRHYLDGAAGRPYRKPRRTTGFGMDWSQRAHRLGASEGHRDAGAIVDELATAKQNDRGRNRRHGLHDRISGLEGRLEALTGISPEMREMGEDLASRILPRILPGVLR